jgi:hypothetical protein
LELGFKVKVSEGQKKSVLKMSDVTKIQNFDVELIGYI